MAYIIPAILLLCGTLHLGLAYQGIDLPPGPYCGITGQCCLDRQDYCSHEILDSVCYCDEFCDKRPSGYDDCCPDYKEVCKGERPVTSTPAPQQAKMACRHGRDGYEPGAQITIGCNKCTCRYPNFSESEYWDCEKEECMISDDVIYSVNRDQRLGWRAANYSQFRDKKLSEGLIFKLGTLPINRETSRMGPLQYNKDIPYPSQFDARTRWPNYISPIEDQGWCGSDWAVTIASVASDRFAIQSNGAEKVQLSAQNLLSCTKNQGCRGGFVDTAWIHLTRQGLVEEKCYPYTATKSICKLKKDGNLIDDRCSPLVPQRTSRYQVTPPGRLVKEEDIMYDIMESGPVQAVMSVHQDFFHYRDGIYRRSRHGNNHLKGLHSVKIIGWGQQNDNKYWLVANSWGTEWGEDGYFRIARGENESGIESFIITATCEVTQAYRK